MVKKKITKQAEKKPDVLTTGVFAELIDNIETLSTMMQAEEELLETISKLRAEIKVLSSPKKIGQKFADDAGHRYILAVAQNDHAVLIDSVTGKRWAQPVKVNDLLNINTSEWGEIAAKGCFFTSVVDLVKEQHERKKENSN